MPPPPLRWHAMWSYADWIQALSRSPRSICWSHCRPMCIHASNRVLRADAYVSRAFDVGWGRGSDADNGEWCADMCCYTQTPGAKAMTGCHN